MIDLSLKTFSNILSEMLSYVSVELNKREGSLIRTSLAAAAWAIEGIYINLANIQKQAYALYATGEYLDYKVAEAGLTRKSATAAVRAARFNMAPPLNSRFQVKDASQNVYYYLSSNAVYSPSTEYPDAPYLGKVTCEEAGTIGNEYSGDLGSVDYVSGLTTAILLGIEIAGTDQESDDSLRERYKAVVGTVNFGGNISSYRNYILEQSGVGGVQVYPTWNGPGTVLCSVIDSNYKPIGNTKISELQYLICPPDAGNTNPSANGYGMAPIGAAVTITTANEVQITITADVKIKTSSSRTLAEIQADAETDVKAYILELCKEWGTMGSFNIPTYTIIIYVNRIIGILNSIDGVEVANLVRINGSASDLILNESGTIGGQNVPSFGSITLSQF